eukprot:397391_1
MLDFISSFITNSTIGYIVALLISIAFGVLWYGPIMGDVWAEGHGVSFHDKKKMEELTKVFNQKSMLSTMCMYLIRIFVVSYISETTNCKTVSDGILLGGILCIGFAFPLTIAKYAFNPSGNKVLLLFDLSYQTMHFVLLTACIVYFNNIQ